MVINLLLFRELPSVSRLVSSSLFCPCISLCILRKLHFRIMNGIFVNLWFSFHTKSMGRLPPAMAMLLVQNTVQVHYTNLGTPHLHPASQSSRGRDPHSLGQPQTSQLQCLEVRYSTMHCHIMHNITIQCTVLSWVRISSQSRE